MAKQTQIVKKRSIIVGDHKTSNSLEDEFWIELRAIAKRQEITLSELVTRVDAHRGASNLSSALRVFVLAEVKRCSSNNEENAEVTGGSGEQVSGQT